MRVSAPLKGRLEGNAVSCVSSRRHRDSLFENLGFYLSAEVGIAKLVHWLAHRMHVEGTGVRFSAGVLSKRHQNLFIRR
jgi:hypothetical protein